MKKNEKGCGGGGGLLSVNIFLGVGIFSKGLSNFRGGLRNFRGGGAVEKFLGGWG